MITPHRTFAASFKADPEIWSSFKETCRFKGVSICHVLEALMQAWIEGQKADATVIKPVTVNLTMQHVVQRPRRVLHRIPPGERLWPPSCIHADRFIKSTKEVACLDIREWIPLEKCWRCWLQKNP